MVEITCLLGLAPKLLLLDEPSSGIAQRETEALGLLLADLKERLAATLVIIEHDIPLIMSLADRVLVLASGRLIASGTPASIRSNESVIDAYLGRDERAIARSGSR
jgi:ABC-type branched-subunit amino acid transport system ATPase component